MGAFTFQSLEKNNKIKVRFVSFLCNFFVPQSGKWLNLGEADSKSPYNVEIQKGWGFISAHS
jgi:hypothetical protein